MKVCIEVHDFNKICFVFEDGTKSVLYSSKEEAFDEAVELYKSNLLSAKAFAELTGNIMKVKELPYTEEILKYVIIALSMLTGLAASGSKHILDQAQEKFDSFFKLPEEVRLEICTCGCNCCWIIHRGGKTEKINSKKKGLFFARALFDSQQITDEEFARLNKQVMEESPLP